ncbi:lantibiotic dehydratase [Pseudofrankia inefficax]|uniref:Lantibiotic dehydratase domain protein n=1 Tax=Pseudofrankia inefficax (strain DSM 45817 / CECT 9037 / DDB 130130 / EuI1c) TaxID=298654 RepID=E3IWB6_PSEI1|nr:lantibiotic dehydratase [Pseudofrankia inefficax]ADP78958.1 Lantibiotic dehydratase domain protein [Pseudofrankia inefficax]
MDPVLAEGITLTSRTAVPSVLGACGDGRLAATVRAFDRRARLRPTPRAVFAGVQTVVVAERGCALRLGGDHRSRSAPSPVSLTVLAEKLLDAPGVVERLTLTTNNLVRRRGQRFERERPALGSGAPELVSIRATAATTLVLRSCEQGAGYDAIRAAVIDRWPAVPEAVMRGMVVEMTRQGFLLTDLLPDDLGDDPIRHLLGRLPDGCDVDGPLAGLRDQLRAADELPLGSARRLAALTSARESSAHVCGQDNPLCVDVAADAAITVPRRLLQDAAEAVSVLWTMSCAMPTLAAYHAHFVERWGHGRFVPFLEVVDPVLGLGDEGIETSIQSAQASPERLAVLAAVLGDATVRGQAEVVLDEATIAALGAPGAEPPPPGAEAYARVLASSEQDLAAGRLHLALYVGGTQDAGSSAGRFTSLLPGSQPRVPDPPAGALVAEVVVRPRIPVLATVAPPTGVAQLRIPVGVPTRHGDLRLDDLLVVADTDRLTLWSQERGCQVVPVLNSRIGPRYLPAEARLLALLGRSGSRPWCLFSWGSLRDTAFQPRVRYRSTIVAPARWRLPRLLTDAASEPSVWAAQLTSWRLSTVPPLPNVVVTDDGERQLPLDLDDPRDAELLRRYVRRGLRAVTEQPGGDGTIQDVVTGPSGRHLLELVIPLAATKPLPAPPRPISALPRPAGAGLHLPGGPWLSLTIGAPTDQHDEILTGLAALLPGLRGLFDRWFWLRYRSPAIGPHLRVRFHGAPAILGGQLLPAVSEWGARLVADALARGFSVEPYDQEIERYGGPSTIEAAEEVFAVDSDLVLAALAATDEPDQRLVVAALTAATVARTVADGDPAALGRPRLDRASHRRLAELRRLVTDAVRDGTIALPLSHPAWERQSDALRAYHDRLAAGRRADCASSVIHMHANRLLGDTAQERIARALAAGLLARETASR